MVKLQAQGESEVFCEIGHVRQLLEHFAEAGDAQKLTWLMSLPASLDLHCYNTVLRGILNAWSAVERFFVLFIVDA